MLQVSLPVITYGLLVAETINTPKSCIIFVLIHPILPKTAEIIPEVYRDPCLGLTVTEQIQMDFKHLLCLNCAQFQQDHTRPVLVGLHLCCHVKLPRFKSFVVLKKTRNPQKPTKETVQHSWWEARYWGQVKHWPNKHKHRYNNYILLLLLDKCIFHTALRKPRKLLLLNRCQKGILIVICIKQLWQLNFNLISLFSSMFSFSH